MDNQGENPILGHLRVYHKSNHYWSHSYFGNPPLCWVSNHIKPILYHYHIKPHQTTIYWKWNHFGSVPFSLGKSHFQSLPVTTSIPSGPTIWGFNSLNRWDIFLHLLDSDNMWQQLLHKHQMNLSEHLYLIT